MNVPVATKTLRILARLLSYPDAETRKNLPLMAEVLCNEGALTLQRLVELKALMDSIASASALEAEEEYVELFDRGRVTSLHLFEHVHGDSRDRGPAMIDLAQTYEKAGLYLAEGELPDYLPVVLEFASTQPPQEARAFLAEMSHILSALFAVLEKRQSLYASVMAALVELAGAEAQSITLLPDEPIDESWAEPVVFDGCSALGQAKPNQQQTIHIMRNVSSLEGVQA